MFILTLEWFGLPDERKRHGVQLEYGFKGKSNDRLRQDWMAAVVPFMEEIGIAVPAHREGDAYVIDCPFPRAFDAQAKTWGEPIGWDAVLERWKARGPMNEAYVEKLQRGYRTTSFRRTR
jgi:ring-1,2-phenylacetyl-CoA epoxidase subunit PaaA